MRRSTTATVFTAVLVLAACGGTDEGESATAAPTETVTETVTETETAEPEETATEPEPAATTTDACGQSGLDSQAFIFVTIPTVGAPLSDGDAVEGCSNVFEAAFQWELRDSSQTVLDDGFGTASCGTGCVGTFSFTPSFSVSQPQVGTLKVFASSAEDGSDVHVNLIPVLLQP